MDASTAQHNAALVSLAVSTVIFALKADSAGEAASLRLPAIIAELERLVEERRRDA